MRHRASRPLIDQWRRLPRAVARPIGGAAKLGPVRATVVLVAMLGAGTTAFVTVASGSDDPPAARDSEVAALVDRGGTTSRAGERLTVSPDSEPAGPTDRRTPTPTVEPEPTESETPETSPTPADELVGPTETASSPTPTPSPSPEEATAAAAVPEDHTAPETSLSADYPDGRTAVFSFTADESASFACRLDGGAWTACGSPTTYSDLDAGWHDFAVRATDETGNVDPTPAETRWHASGGPGSDD